MKDRELSAATCRLYLNAIRFFYLQVLHWPDCQLEVVTPKRPQRIPYLLSPGEVRRIIDHADNPKYAMMLAQCYACGLRVSTVQPIFSAIECMADHCDSQTRVNSSYTPFTVLAMKLNQNLVWPTGYDNIKHL